MSPMGACRVLFPLAALECGGHGKCVAAAGPGSRLACLCDAGWSNVGDLAPWVDGPCVLYTPLIQAEWGIAIASLSCLVAASLRALRKRFYAGKIIANRGLSWANAYQWLPFVLFIVQAALFIPFGILKIVNPVAYSVGNNALVTILYCLGTSAFWSAMVLITYWFLRLSALSFEKQFKTPGVRAAQLALLTQRGLAAVFFLDFIWNFSPLLMLINSDFVLVVGGLHFIGLGFSITIVTALTMGFIKSLQSDITATLSVSANVTEGTAQLANLSRKLRISMKAIPCIGANQACLALIIGVWPLFLVTISYQFPISWGILTGLLGSIVAWITTNSKDKKPSTAPSFASSVVLANSKSYQQLPLTSGRVDS